jgi:hypothetical protein
MKVQSITSPASNVATYLHHWTLCESSVLVDRFTWLLVYITKDSFLWRPQWQELPASEELLWNLQRHPTLVDCVSNDSFIAHWVLSIKLISDLYNHVSCPFSIKTMMKTDNFRWINDAFFSSEFHCQLRRKCPKLASTSWLRVSSLIGLFVEGLSFINEHFVIDSWLGYSNFGFSEQRQNRRATENLNWCQLIYMIEC